jgi:uncharacterized protein (TIGR02145 family)
MRFYSLLFFVFLRFETIAQEIKIDTLIWMNKNLNVETFRNGDKIPEAKSVADWEKFSLTGTPCYSYYNVDPANGKTHGKIYNGYAVLDPRGLAPKRWHIATENEWLSLTKFKANDPSSAIYFATILDSVSWNLEQEKSNQLKFNATPAGVIQFEDGHGFKFSGLNENTAWWTQSKGVSPSTLKSISLDPKYYVPFEITEDKMELGRSVRCVKD